MEKAYYNTPKVYYMSTHIRGGHFLVCAHSPNHVYDLEFDVTLIMCLDKAWYITISQGLLFIFYLFLNGDMESGGPLT